MTTPLRWILVGGLVAACVAGCGSHVDTTLPEIPRSTVLVDREIQSSIDSTEWGRYMIVIGDGSETSRSLTKRIRSELDADGWQTRPQRHPHPSVLAESTAPDGIEFGPASGGMRGYVPRAIVQMLNETPGPSRQKVLVAIR